MKKLIFFINNFNPGGVQNSLMGLINSIRENYIISIILNEKHLIKDIEFTNIPILQFSFFERFMLKYYYQKTYSIFSLSFFLKVLSRLIVYSKLFDIFLFIHGKFFSFDCELFISYIGMPGIWDKIIKYRVNSKTKLIWLHNDPEKIGVNKNTAKVLFKIYSYVVVISYKIKETLLKLIDKEKIYVVYNKLYINKFELSKKSNNPFTSQENKIVFLSISRFQNDSKAIDRFIIVSNFLINKGIKNFVFNIIGNGGDFFYIKNLIETNNLKNNVILHGEIRNPYNYIQNCTFGVLLSKYEGMPVFFEECKYFGKPIITTNYLSVNEQVIDGINGLIIPQDIESICNSFYYLLIDKPKIESLINHPNHLSTIQKVDDFNKIF